MRNYWSFIILLLLVPNLAYCADLNFTLQHLVKDNNVIVTLDNRSASVAAIKSLDVVLNEQTFYPEHIQSTIEPHSKIQSQFLITSPDTPGTYPVVITLRYLNDGQILSLRHMGLFNYKQSSLMSEACTAENATFGQEGDITIRSTDPGAWKIILPDEINSVSESLYPDHKVFHVRNTVHDFNNNYPYFAVAEKEANGLHSAASAAGRHAGNACHYGTASRLDPRDARGSTPTAANLRRPRTMPECGRLRRGDPPRSQPRPGLLQPRQHLQSWAGTPRRWPTTTRRSASIPTSPRPTPTAASPTRDLGRHAEALADYDAAIRLDPNSPRPLQPRQHLRATGPRR